MLVDPSGHWTYYLEGADGQCLTPGSPGLPTILEVERLSTVKHIKTGISAKDLYLDYLARYDDKSGWWWDLLGGRDGFTLADYLSIWGHIELKSRAYEAKILAEAGFRVYVGWTETLGYQKNTYTLLDWFSQYSGSAGKYIRQGVPLRDIDVPNLGLLDSTFGLSLVNPEKAWLSGLDPGRPYGWGNESVLSPDQAAVFELFPDAMFFVYATFPGSDTFYIPSGCAWTDWETGDLSHWRPGKP